MTEVLNLTLIGGFEAHWGSGEKLHLRSKKARALLAYLALSGGAQSREHLAGLLWDRSAEAQARASLRQEIRALKLATEHQADAIWTDPDSIGVDLNLISSDVERLLAGQDDLTLSIASNDLTLLGGAIIGSEPFEEWRRGLEIKAHAALQTQAAQRLKAAEEAENHQQILQAARLLIQIDPLEAAAYRAIISAECALGRPSAALKAFKSCEASYRQEMNSGPPAEIVSAARAARRQLRASARQEAPPTVVGGAPATAAPLRPQLSLWKLVPKFGSRARARQAAAALSFSALAAALLFAGNALRQQDARANLPALRIDEDAAEAPFEIYTPDPDGAATPNWTWIIDTNADGLPDLETTFGAAIERHDLPPGDYNGDGRADFAVVRTLPNTGLRWRIDTDHDGHADLQIDFGVLGDVLAPADYDGDGLTDPAVVTPIGRRWLWRVDLNRDGAADIERIFGQRTSNPDLSDRPIAVDFNGDGAADFAMVRKTRVNPRRRWIWLIDTDRDGAADYEPDFGLSTSDAVDPHDYNGDGKADLAVRREKNYRWVWYVDFEISGEAYPDTDINVWYGGAYDHPAPGDYDGDGATDFAFVRLEDGRLHWRIDTNRDGRTDQSVAFGGAADVPKAADYDGDGRVDLAVLRKQ